METLTGMQRPLGECIDAVGDVFIVSGGSNTSELSNIYEYAHGGTSPIAILDDPGYGVGCAVDPTTGNLAVANAFDPNNPYYGEQGDVAVYLGAQGNPTMHYSAVFGGFGLCGYDDAGNLYVEGNLFSSQTIELARLANGKSSLELVQLSKPVYTNSASLPSVQWDGSHMTITSSDPNQRAPVSVYRLNVFGSKAKVTSTTKLRSKKNRHGGQTWIERNSIVGVTYSGKYGGVSFWNFPQGGRPTGTIRKIAVLSKTELYGVTISPAQSH